MRGTQQGHTFRLLFCTSLLLNVGLFVYYQVTILSLSKISATESPCHRELEPAGVPFDEPSDDPHSCRSMMRSNVTLSDGAFLTQLSAGHTWRVRADDSRELHLQKCTLHRYGAAEARQCLSNRHVSFIGDSLTRYQYLSLTYFLHKGVYPPRFGREKNNCTHRDETGQPTCSSGPNVVMEGDFVGESSDPQIRDAWEWYHASVGGWNDGGFFDGRLECNCARSSQATCGKSLPGGDCVVENMLYYGENNMILSNIGETGWHAVPRPTIGFDFTHCGLAGSCRRTANETRTALQRAFVERSYDWNQSLPDALRVGGALRQQLPPIDISLYNRGLWNSLPVESAKQLFPLLRNATNARCFYKTTTGCQRSPPRWKHEKEKLKDVAEDSGCGYYDIGLLTSEFSSLNQSQPEYLNVFWDAVHYKPWVYEELNNILLNILCNADTRKSAAEGSSAGQ